MEETTPQNVRSLPKAPGVYLFVNKAGDLLYVGKAKSLAARVSQYFLKNKDDAPKTRQLVPQISRIRTIQTRSEFEALLLEAKLIHSYQPKYNVLAKDDKSPLYFMITEEELPRVLFIRKPKSPAAGEDKHIYFGPFQSPRAVRTLLRRLRSVVPYCTQKMRTGRACFYTQLGLCSPCPSKISGLPREDPQRTQLTRLYRRNMRRLASILSGKTIIVMRDFEREIRSSAARLDFEKAAEAKEHLDALLSILETPLDPSWYTQRDSALEDQYRQEEEALRTALSSVMSLPPNPVKRIECYDISNLFGTHPTGSLVVSEGGIMDRSWYRRFHVRGKNRPNDVAMIAEVLTRRLRHPEWPAPDLIMVDGGKPQVASARAVLAKHGSTIPLIGLAKRFEQIIVPTGNSDFKVVNLPLDSPALHLLRRIRDEAHRFALTYHRQLRRKLN